MCYRSGMLLQLEQALVGRLTNVFWAACLVRE